MQLNENLVITPEIYEKCKQFAKASVSSSVDKYAKRNQFDVEKITKDIMNGKIGEELVYSQLISKFPKLNPPDHQIYSKKEKSWSPDLKDLGSGTKIAVKSQDISAEIAFSRSWVFQYNNSRKFDCDTGIFGKDQDNHYVTFVSLNVPKRMGIIRAIVKVSWLHQNKMFKEMKKQSLKGNKLAVYFDDLEKFTDELNQL